MSNQRRVVEAVEHIRALRRAERAADPLARGAIAGAREFIESVIGGTVRPATAAQLLGVSQTALARWLGRGEISSVLTPKGRREIPLVELLDLLDDSDRLGARNTDRPLAVVMRERRRAAEEAVNLDRLLPRPKSRSHRTAELQALAYHRLVAERMDDELAERARRQLARWRESGRIHTRWADEWQRVLALPLPELAEAISADTPRAAELRQTSPFAGAITEQERRLLVEAVERRVSA